MDKAHLIDLLYDIFNLEWLARPDPGTYLARQKSRAQAALRAIDGTEKLEVIRALAARIAKANGEESPSIQTANSIASFWAQLGLPTDWQLDPESEEQIRQALEVVQKLNNIIRASRQAGELN